jgi:hypothetical protein
LWEVPLGRCGVAAFFDEPAFGTLCECSVEQCSFQKLRERQPADYAEI